MNPQGMKRARWTAAALGMALCFFLLPLLWVEASCAASAQIIDGKVDLALERLRTVTRGGIEQYFRAKGALIVPRVLNAGLIVGGEYGVGALRIGGKTVDYYSLTSGSLGFQVGAQEKDIILLFMDEERLKKFRAGDSWRAGGAGSLIVANTGLEGSFDTINPNDYSLIVYAFGHRGLMVNVSLEGTKFTKLKK